MTMRIKKETRILLRMSLFLVHHFMKSDDEEKYVKLCVSAEAIHRVPTASASPVRE